MSRYPTISLCMIAKDEERWIGQCIESVRALVKETIVVDTGSSDRTIAIAEGLGARVFHRPWDDDFSAPRNLSIAKAAGDWILVLDADEAIDTADHARLRELSLSGGICYLLTQRHYSNDPRLSGFSPARGEHPKWERNFGGFFESSCVRFFPNRQGIEYRNRIHELVEPCIQELGKHKIAHSGILIHHYGHTDNLREKRRKGELYTSLGERKLKDKPMDWKGHFELAVEHQVNGRLAESIAAFHESLRLLPTYIDSWINLGYVLGESRRYEEGTAALQQALKLNPKSHEAYCNLGVIYLRTSHFPLAARCFEQAIALKRDYVNAWCNLGETFSSVGNYRKAASVFQEALKLFPQCAKAKEGLGTCLFFLGEVGEAERILTESAASDGTLSRPHYWLGQINRLNDKIGEAIRCFEQFCEVEKRKNSPSSAQVVKLLEHECEELKRFMR